MEIEITYELLELIQDRAEEVGRIKFGTAPTNVILENGRICLRYESYCCGSYEYESEYINASDLTKDLDILAEEAKKELERKQEEEKQRRERIIKEQQEKKDKEERELYLKLKNKFG